MNEAHNNQDPVKVIESLMAQEQADLAALQINAHAATEPKLKSIYERLVDIHSTLYAELRSVLDDLQSRKVITDQINDVYR